MQAYQKQVDPVLKEYYCTGNNEVPHYWIQRRYFNYLLAVVQWRVRDTEEGKDVLANVVAYLCQVALPERGQKIKLVNDSAKKSLMWLSKNRAISTYRKQAKLDGLKDENLPLYEPEKDFVSRIEAKDLVHLIRERVLEKHGEAAAVLLDLIYQYPGEIKPIAAFLKLDSDTVRKQKIAVLRQARRIALLLK